MGAPAAHGLPARTAVADRHPAAQGADALHNAGGSGMRGAHTTDATTNANTAGLDQPPGNLPTLAVSREVEMIDHHDHLPEEETDVVED
eukprot:3365421-Pyramimonas_sp.AAC.1